MTKQSTSAVTLDTLRQACIENGLEDFTVNQKSLEGLLSYLTLLMKWNKVMNLVGRTDWHDALVTLIADSMHLAQALYTLQDDKVLCAEPEVWDLGAGAGLPGIPLRLLWQCGRYSLVDAREKRMLFLRTVLAEFPLENVFVVQGRVETFMPTQPKADLIVSRAFMPWEQVLEIVAPYMQHAGIVTFLTLQPAPQSVISIKNIAWECVHEAQYSIANDTRYIWALSRKEQ